MVAPDWGLLEVEASLALPVGDCDMSSLLIPPDSGDFYGFDRTMKRFHSVYNESGNGSLFPLV